MARVIELPPRDAEHAEEDRRIVRPQRRRPRARAAVVVIVAASLVALALWAPTALRGGGGGDRVLTLMLAGTDVSELEVSGDGTVWAVTGSWGVPTVRRFHDGAWSEYTPRVCSRDVMAGRYLSAGPGGTALIACGSSVERFDGTAWTTIDGPEPSTTILRALPGLDGRLWALTVDAPPDYTTLRYWSFADGRWSAIETASEHASVPFEHGPDGSLWVPTGSGVARYDGHAWTELAPEGAQGWAGFVVVGRDGSVWRMTYDPGYIVWQRFANGRWTFPSVDLGLAALDDRCLPVRPLDSIGFDSTSGQLGNPPRIAVGSDGSLWAALTCVGIVRFDPRTATTTIFNKASRALREAAAGSAATFGPVDFSAWKQFTDLDVSPDGTVWVAGDWGVARLG